MELSNHSVKAYLTILILFGIFDVLIGIYLRAKSARPDRARKMFFRGGALLLSGCSFLALLRSVALNGWIVLMAAGLLLFLNEYLIVAVEKYRSRKSPPPAISEQKPNWDEIRKRGRNRFALTSVAVYTIAGLWLAIPLKIILPALPFYLLTLLVIAFSTGGWVASIREWNRKERDSRTTPEPQR